MSQGIGSMNAQPILYVWWHDRQRSRAVSLVSVAARRWRHM